MCEMRENMRFSNQLRDAAKAIVNVLRGAIH